MSLRSAVVVTFLCALCGPALSEWNSDDCSASLSSDDSDCSVSLLQTAAVVRKHPQADLAEVSDESIFKDDVNEGAALAPAEVENQVVLVGEEVPADMEAFAKLPPDAKYVRCHGIPWRGHISCRHIVTLRHLDGPGHCNWEARVRGGDSTNFLYRGGWCQIKQCGLRENLAYAQRNPDNWELYSIFCGPETPPPPPVVFKGPWIHSKTHEGDCGTETSNLRQWDLPPALACVNRLDFSNLVQNNLGGKGPDDGTEVIRFGSALPGIDLLIFATSEYKPFRAHMNGHSVNNGNSYGMINLFSGNRADLTFRFENRKSKEMVEVDKLFFSLFDIDQGGSCSSRTRVSLESNAFDTYYLTDNSEIVVGSRQDGRTFFASSTKGNGNDNPIDPMSMDQQQANRAVTFFFQNVKQIKMTYEILNGRNGRNLLFGGISSLVGNVCN